MIDYRVNSFLAVCRFMSYTKAAEELKLTQPAISQHIKFLEDYYHCQLFEYKSRKLILTEQGRLLRSAMEALRHDSMRIEEDIQKIDSRKTLRLGASLSIGEYYLPEHLARMLKNNPNMDLSITVADTQELLKRLDNGDLDIALCEGNFNKKDYDWKLLFKDRLVPYCGKDYDVSGITDMESLFEHRLLVREEGSGTRAVFENYLKQRGYSLSYFKSISDFNTPRLIVKLLIENMGISFLYEMVAREYLAFDILKEVSLSDFALEHEMNAIWTKNSIYTDSYLSFIDEITRQ